MKDPTAPLTIIVDTREQCPWYFAREVEDGACQVKRECLTTGDYSVDPLHELVAIERKSISDLWSCVGHGRERFEAQVERLSQIPFSCLIVEGSLSQVAHHKTKAHPEDTRRLKASHVIGTLTGWSMKYGIQVWYGGSPRESERLAFLWLRYAFKKWQEKRCEEMEKLLAWIKQRPRLVACDPAEPAG